MKAQYLIVLGVLLIGGQNAIANSPAMEEMSSFVEGARDIKGNLPSEGDFYEYLAQHPTPLREEEEKAAWAYWLSAQRPPLTATQLLAIVNDKRRMLRNGVMQYTVGTSFVSDEVETSENRTEAYDTAFSGEMALLMIDREPTGEPDALRIIRSYDGQDYRRYDWYSESTKRGYIGKLQSRNDVIHTEGPLGMSMLLDSKQDCEMPRLTHDLGLFLERGAVVYEGLEAVDGLDCLVCGISTPAVFKVYLDPARNYSVIRFEQYRVLGGAGGEQRRRMLMTNWTCCGLVEVATGVFLPTDIVQDWYRTDAKEGVLGSHYAQRKTQVKELQVNNGIDARKFKDIFPLGTRVRDRNRNLTYESGIQGSIESLLVSELTAVKAELSLPSHNNEERNVLDGTPAQPRGPLSRVATSARHDRTWWLVFAVLCILAVISTICIRLRRGVRG